MARQRPIKIYSATVYPNNDVMNALGERSHIRQAQGWVAARSLKEAAALLGTNLGDWGAHLYHGNADREVVRACMAKPGQVFVTSKDSYRNNGSMVEAAVSLRHESLLELGAQSDLALAEALLQRKADLKAQAQEDEERRVRERQERQQRREQNDRAIQEALDRIRPVLESLGISPQTVVAGRGTQQSGVERQGILISAEAAERLVRLADIGERFEGEVG